LACIDPIDPDYKGIVNENRLVVDANLSVSDSIHTIRLSRTFDIGRDGSDSQVINARIFIESNSGISYDFEETLPGHYILPGTAVCFENDESYQLNVVLEDGSEYYSSSVVLPEVVEFDDVKYRIGEEAIIRDEREIFIPVLEVVASNNDFKEQAVYYQVEYEGVFSYRGLYQGSTECWPACFNSDEEPPEDISPRDFCYIPEVVRKPLNVVELKPTDNKLVILSSELDFKFARQYSMNLIINTISKSHFELIEAQNSQLEYGGGIFDPPPTNIVGNITSTSSARNYALGNFHISNSYSTRIFIENVSGVQDNECLYEQLPPPACTKPPYDYCCDCRLYPGAKTKMPSFFN